MRRLAVSLLFEWNSRNEPNQALQLTADRSVSTLKVYEKVSEVFKARFRQRWLSLVSLDDCALMGTLKPRMAENLREIQRILLREWDPIGIRNSPSAEHEYDSYAVPIYSFLRQNPSEKSLVDHLYQIETKRMGLTRFGMHRHLRPVAKRLLQLDLTADEPLQ